MTVPLRQFSCNHIGGLIGKLTRDEPLESVVDSEVFAQCCLDVLVAFHENRPQIFVGWGDGEGFVPLEVMKNFLLKR